jgi:hypothetical protein
LAPSYNDFNQLGYQKKTFSRKSGDAVSSNRMSSDGEGSLYNNNGDANEMVVGGVSTTPLVDDRCIILLISFFLYILFSLESMTSLFEHGSDYHDQLERYGYIFQSPDVQVKNPYP